MIVKPIPIAWHPGLPIFAHQSFLESISDEYGWLGGFAESGDLRCVLPYTVVNKAMFRLVRFRVETIPMAQGFDIYEEKSFLNETVSYFRSIRADMIIPATTNTIFRTYPDGAEAAPYGSYIINLSEPEEVLWRNVAKISRQNIGTAIRSGVTIRSGLEYVETSHALVKATFKRSKLPFMSLEAYKRFIEGLGKYGMIMVAEYQGTIQSTTAYAFSDYCAYAIYGGNIVGVHQGTMKLLQWEAIRLFQKLGVRSFDFVGARINPKSGSKQEAINSFKRRFGATLKQGYIWKYPLRPFKYLLYGLAARIRSGGDIVDAERHKMIGYIPSAQ